MRYYEDYDKDYDENYDDEEYRDDESCDEI